GLEAGSTAARRADTVKTSAHARHFVSFPNHSSENRCRWPQAGHLQKNSMNPPVAGYSYKSILYGNGDARTRGIVQTTYPGGGVLGNFTHIARACNPPDGNRCFLTPMRG